MKLLGCLLVLTGVVCCTAAPASDTEKPPGSCEPPTRLPDQELQGDWNEKFYSHGEFAQYSCRPGFIRLGPIRYVCRNGVWESASTGQCKKKSCGHPGDIEFGTFELKKEESFVFGAVVEYICNDGYQMISRHRTRECTATGWTNYRPECEVKFCPPVQVSKNVNLLTTSYEEEYSVGQVIRFECKNVNQKLNGASEIFCTSEGEWNAQPPTCEEVKCSPPEIVHGGVSNPKTIYMDKETLGFSCENGYKPSTTSLLTCTKNDWTPTPLCEEIVCYQESVKNGIVKYTEDTYRDGDTVTLTCDEGYQIEHKPEEPRRTCTARGWSPSLKCISKKCSRPVTQNAFIEYLNWYSFPMTPSSRSYFYFDCNSGFLTSRKDTRGTIYCTKNGWNPEPNCYRKCNAPSQDSINAHIFHRASQLYIEGEKLRFQCHKDYKTLDEQTDGEIECLPDGRFSGEKCYKNCQTPNLDNGEYKTNSNVFDIGAHLIYGCNEGFISSNNKVEGISQCGNNGWQPKPECKGMSCTLKKRVNLKMEETNVKVGEVVHFNCPIKQVLEGSNTSQCFYYGWSPALPHCKGGKTKYFPLVDYTRLEESNCPSISAPPNGQLKNPKTEYFSEDEIEIVCDPGYQLDGSKKVLCKDGKWQSPPWCIEIKQCRRPPPQIQNGKIHEETLANQYYSGSSVKYVCTDGYHIIGSDESKCIDGKWLAPPTCEGNFCRNPQEILHGKAQDNSRVYRHRERAAYICSPGYKLSRTEPALCYLGKWSGVPECIDSSCGPPPIITNGALREVQKNTYLTDEKAIYDCASGYTLGQNANYITCKDSVWTEPPVCKKIGHTCGEPPEVKSGDITQIRLKTYQSGTSVIYKCANFYKLEGKEVITCKDGEWEKEPVCRVPCTVKETNMEQNNIQLKFKAEKNKKIYSEHFDNMTFECRDGYEISDQNLLRIQCLDGVLNYPRCLKRGSCVLQQTNMAINNIRYNKSTELENGQTIEFQCDEGMVSVKGLEATCKNKQIIYPKCTAGRSCPPLKISNAKLSPEKQDGYESGSSVNINCEDTFVLSGNINVKCENNKWDELPQCLKPCSMTASNLEINHIELLPQESTPDIIEHGKEVKVKCKANFKRPGFLKASCYDGVMKYPKCFSGGTCRIIQQDLDDNFVELDERHDNEVFYKEGETVSFKCKTGYRNRDGLTGTCTKSEAKQPAEYTLTYPTCTQEYVM